MIPDDHRFAEHLAVEAGRLLMQLRGRDEEAGRVSWRTGDEGDLLAHRWLMNELATHRPDDAVLSEEGADNRLRLESERVWILDPLDGSVDFSSPYSTNFAVHIALVENGRATVGAVSLPAYDEVFVTDRPVAPPAAERAPVVIASRAQAHWGRALAEELDGEVLIAGSAGVKAMAVVGGDADVYLHPTGLYEWDVCAPAVVAQASGLVVTGIDGSELEYNQSHPVVPGFIVCRPGLVDQVRHFLQPR